MVIREEGYTTSKQQDTWHHLPVPAHDAGEKFPDAFSTPLVQPGVYNGINGAVEKGDVYRHISHRIGNLKFKVNQLNICYRTHILNINDINIYIMPKVMHVLSGYIYDPDFMIRNVRSGLYCPGCKTLIIFYPSHK